MAKISEYLEANGSPSAARLCCLWGLISSALCSFIALISWVFADNAPNWALVGICAVPGTVGIIPLVFQYLRKLTDSGKLEEVLKILKDRNEK